MNGESSDANIFTSHVGAGSSSQFLLAADEMRRWTVVTSTGSNACSRQSLARSSKSVPVPGADRVDDRTLSVLAVKAAEKLSALRSSRAVGDVFFRRSRPTADRFAHSLAGLPRLLAILSSQWRATYATWSQCCCYYLLFFMSASETVRTAFLDQSIMLTSVRPNYGHASELFKNVTVQSVCHVERMWMIDRWLNHVKWINVWLLSWFLGGGILYLVILRFCI